ncbi:MAG: MOSC domain-containing protein [Vicinamibacterales bacterium]
MTHVPPTVLAVARDAAHRFSKATADRIHLVQGLGVQGDAHAGVTVQHRSRVAKNPGQPNLRQVHLIAGELLAQLRAEGFPIEPGMLGENITTNGIDLVGLPTGTRLRIGSSAVVEVTGLRNPCVQIENFHEGLLSAVLERDGQGHVHRKSGVMSIVLSSGDVVPGDAIQVELPATPHRPLEVV